MGRHTRGEPITPEPGQAPYGVNGPATKLFAGERDPVQPDLGPRMRTVQELTLWEQALWSVPCFALAFVFLWVLPHYGVPFGWAHWVGWLVSNGPLYIAADRYAAFHDPWRGPRWLRRDRDDGGDRAS